MGSLFLPVKPYGEFTGMEFKNRFQEEELQKGVSLHQGKDKSVRFSNLFLIVFFTSNISINAQCNTIQEKADYLCTIVMNQKPLDYKSNFSPEFTNNIPEDYLTDLASELINAVGTCTKTEVEFSNSIKAKYKFISRSLRYVSFEFSLDKSNLINGLLITDVVFPDVILTSWQDVETYSNSLKGVFSVSVKNFSKSISISKNNLTLQPIGSAFKLYVLGALADKVKNGYLDWGQTFPIKTEWKSLPSGIMQDWEDGKQVSLKTYADYMIKLSDNTATDHLINIIGRNAVESQLSLMKNSFEHLNRPFLTTAEMFKIKWASPIDIINSFISAEENEKREILHNNIASTSIDNENHVVNKWVFFDFVGKILKLAENYF